MQQAQGAFDRERIELFLAARNLKDQDIMSVSDPKAKVWIKAPNGTETLVGTTEVISNNLNPNWKKTVEIDYIFEINQYIRFEVWDVDSNGNDDLIGVAETSVGTIMGAKNQVLSVPLKKKHKEGQGHFVIKADQVKLDQNFVKWQWKGKKMMNTDGFFGKSDPFLIFFRKKENDWLRVYETPYIKDTLSPVWPPFELPLAKLNGGNPNQNFRIECWDNSKSGNHNFIGFFETSIAQLTAGGQAEHKLENPKEKKPGYLIMETCTFFRKPTFMDYLQGGEQINMMIAIDFTGSNGNPTDPHSLHSIIPGAYNQYQTALYQVSQVLLNYDHDQNIPLYGFGGVPKFPNYNKNQTEHCFPLTGSFEKPEVHGLDGIMQFYSGALQYVQLAGPTYFAPVLEYAKQIAQKNFENEQDVYTVLLILTDGEIHDFDKSMNLIIECMKLPISIIIIGVGNESFGQMKKLDGDDGPLKGHRSGIPYRDLVQFVAYQEFKNDPTNLARAVLAELPQQLLAYKSLVNKQPRQKIDVHLSQFK